MLQTMLFSEHFSHWEAEGLEVNERYKSQCDVALQECLMKLFAVSNTCLCMLPYYLNNSFMYRLQCAVKDLSNLTQWNVVLCHCTKTIYHTVVVTGRTGCTVTDMLEVLES